MNENYEIVLYRLLVRVMRNVFFVVVFFFFFSLQRIINNIPYCLVRKLMVPFPFFRMIKLMLLRCATQLLDVSLTYVVSIPFILIKC